MTPILDPLSIRDVGAIEWIFEDEFHVAVWISDEEFENEWALITWT